MSWKKIVGKAAGVVGGAIGLIGGPKGAAAGFAIGSAVGGALLGSEAEKSERRAAREQRRLAQLQAQRQRKELIRDVQFARAGAMAGHVGSGLGIASSTIQGQQAAMRTTLSDDLGFQDVGGDVADAVWRHTRRADSFRSSANLVRGLGSAVNQLSPVIPTGSQTPEGEG